MCEVTSTILKLQISVSQSVVILTTVLFIRVVQAVVQSITAQLFRDTDVVSTGPVRLQTALGRGTVLLV